MGGICQRSSSVVVKISPATPRSKAAAAANGQKKHPSITSATSANSALSTQQQQQHPPPPQLKQQILPTDMSAAAAAEGRASPLDLRDPNVLNQTLDALRQEEHDLQALARLSRLDINSVRKLQVLFQQLASNGRIDQPRLATALGLPADSPIAAALFRLFDVARTNALNFRTFVLGIGAMSSKATLDDKIRFTFAFYDVNRCGFIEEQELRSLIRAALREMPNALGFQLTDAQMDDICRATLESCDGVSAAPMDMPPPPPPATRKVSRANSSSQAPTQPPQIGGLRLNQAGYRTLVEHNPHLMRPFSIDVNSLLPPDPHLTMSDERVQIQQQRKLIPAFGKPPALERLQSDVLLRDCEAPELVREISRLESTTLEPAGAAGTQSKVTSPANHLRKVDLLGPPRIMLMSPASSANNSPENSRIVRQGPFSPQRSRSPSLSSNGAGTDRPFHIPPSAPSSLPDGPDVAAHLPQTVSIPAAAAVH